MSDQPFEHRHDDERREYHQDPQRRDQGSLFWPVVLIGVGVIWLLSNFGVIPDQDLGLVLRRLWPVILIVVGLDLLMDRRWPALGALIGLATVALVVVLLIYGPQLGIASEGRATFLGFPVITRIDDADIQTERYTEPLGEAQSAEVALSLHPGRTIIRALDDSNALVDAELDHIGGVDYSVSGSRTKTVRLGQRGAIALGPLVTNTSRLVWDIALTPAIPLALSIDARSGLVEADLSQLRLQSLEVDVGSGRLDMTLPEGATDYRARIDSGSGATRVVVPEGAVLGDLAIDGGSGALDLDIEADARLQATIDAGSGRIVVDVPAQAGVRVRVTEDGSGSFLVPGDYRRVEGRSGNVGVWESPYHASATQHVELQFALSSGRVEVR